MARKPEIVTCYSQNNRRTDRRIVGNPHPVHLTERDCPECRGMLPTELFEYEQHQAHPTQHRQRHHHTYNQVTMSPRPPLPGCVGPHKWLCPTELTTFLDPVGVIFQNSSPLDPKTGSFCSGVLVGPRHVLTTASALNWTLNHPTSPTKAGLPPLSFAPSYCWGDSPYGQVTVDYVITWPKALIPAQEGLVPEPSFDIAICLLSKKIQLPNPGFLPMDLPDGDLTKQKVSQIGYPAMFPYPAKSTKQGKKSVPGWGVPQTWGPEALYLVNGKIGIVYAHSFPKSAYELIILIKPSGKLEKLSTINAPVVPKILSFQNSQGELKATGGYGAVLYTTDLFHDVGMEGGPVIGYGIAQKLRVFGAIRRVGLGANCFTTFAGGNPVTTLFESALLLYG